jgi:hypothetical protein
MGLAWALDGAALIVSVVDSEYAGIQPSARSDLIV